jgi:hypothetical protein
MIAYSSPMREFSIDLFPIGKGLRGFPFELISYLSLFPGKWNATVEIVDTKRIVLGGQFRRGGGGIRRGAGSRYPATPGDKAVPHQNPHPTNPSQRKV